MACHTFQMQRPLRKVSLRQRTVVVASANFNLRSAALATLASSVLLVSTPAFAALPCYASRHRHHALPQHLTGSSCVCFCTAQGNDQARWPIRLHGPDLPAGDGGDHQEQDTAELADSDRITPGTPDRDHAHQASHVCWRRWQPPAESRTVCTNRTRGHGTTDYGIGDYILRMHAWARRRLRLSTVSDAYVTASTHSKQDIGVADVEGCVLTDGGHIVQPRA
jgi:hypothetical protein